MYTPGGKFSIIEFGLEKLHKTVYNFLKSNPEPNPDIPELLIVRDPPGRVPIYRPTGVPNRLRIDVDLDGAAAPPRGAPRSPHSHHQRLL